MDINRFGDNFPGKLLPIPGGDHAFLPHPLPACWEFPTELWPSLAEAKQQVALLEGIGRTLPDAGILLSPQEDREAIRSSRLEGTYATPTELLLFEMESRLPRASGKQLNEWREVLNYRHALEYATTADLPLSLRLIREMHRILMEGVRGKDRTPGEFRRLQVAIGTDHRFVPPPPDRLSECLDAFEKYLHGETSFDPLVDCFLVHYQFEAIHPFRDGNGRVGRLLLTVMLQQRCRLTKPWLYLSEYFERNRDEYFRRLFGVSAEGDWCGWIGFCLAGAIEQATATIERCDRLRAIPEECLQRIVEVGGNVRLTQIVERLFHAPIVRVADLPKRLGVTYPTAKADVDRLVQAGILRELERTPRKTFFAPQIFEAAYGGIED